MNYEGGIFGICFQSENGGNVKSACELLCRTTQTAINKRFERRSINYQVVTRAHRLLMSIDSYFNIRNSTMMGFDSPISYLSSLDLSKFVQSTPVSHFWISFFDLELTFCISEPCLFCLMLISDFSDSLRSFTLDLSSKFSPVFRTETIISTRFLSFAFSDFDLALLGLG